MRLSLRVKVTITVSLFLTVVFALIMYLSITRSISQQQASLNQQSKSFAALATSPIGNTFLLYQDSGSIKITQQVDKYLALDPDITSVRIVSVDGSQQFDSQGGSRPRVTAGQASSFQPLYLKNKAGYIGEVIQPFFEDSGAHRYSIVYDISTARVAKDVADEIRLILYIDVAILIVSIVAASWALNAMFIKPLREVSRSADIISSGNYSQQIVTHAASQDEIGKLAQAVNSMADSLKSDIVKLQELDKLKTEFMMIASHNLRTPLTIMRGAIESADYAKTAEELKDIIANVQDGVIRLHLLAEDLLTISTLESGAEALKKVPVDAKLFVDSTVSEFEVMAKKKGLEWVFEDDLPDYAKLELSQSNMRSALGNVLDNAIKFTKQGGSVRVSALVVGSSFVFKVEDTGIGISPDEMAKLFTKFHRGTGTERYDYEGVGIGLYLTKLLVEQHGGSVKVASEVGKGSTFTITLPLIADHGSSAPTGHDVHPHGA